MLLLFITDENNIRLYAAIGGQDYAAEPQS
jgi:hypothetical protein